jgi:D-3-phosphoglycerate dehydrogenase
MQLSQEAKDILQAAKAKVIYLPDPITEAVLIDRLAQDRVNGVILRGSPPLTRRVFEAARDLRIIAKHGAGVDSVDLEAATAHGVVVVTAGGANADAVAEQTLAHMLSLVRELPRLDRNLKQGKWEKPMFKGRGFRGRTVGIVGYGQIGRRVAALAQAFGAKVTVYSRTKRAGADGVEWEDDFERLLAKVDILSLHCPLTEKTRGLIGAKELALMKPGALLINTSRGPVVDEAALYDALKSGRLAGAGLDTLAKEPADPANPLFRLDNITITPHVAAMTAETMARMGAIASTNVVGYLQSGACDRESVVNPEVLEKRGA